MIKKYSKKEGKKEKNVDKCSRFGDMGKSPFGIFAPNLIRFHSYKVTK
jgi:hypothetical protein